MKSSPLGSVMTMEEPAFVAASNWIIGETKVVVLPEPVEPMMIE